MIATNNTSFLNIEDMSKSKNNLSFLVLMKKNFLTIKKMNTIRSLLISINKDVELYFKINNITTVEEIDNTLLLLEDLSDEVEGFIEEEVFNSWYEHPLRYILERVQDASMSLQATLGIKQAQMMSRNESN